MSCVSASRMTTVSYRSRRAIMAKRKILWPSVVVLAFVFATGMPSVGTTGPPSTKPIARATALQGTGRILGVLRGGIFCNRAVPGVAVSLGTTDGRMTATDSDGFFFFSDLGAGTYVLAANIDYCDLA